MWEAKKKYVREAALLSPELRTFCILMQKLRGRVKEVLSSLPSDDSGLYLAVLYFWNLKKKKKIQFL